MPQQISPGSRTCYTRIGGHIAFADTHEPRLMSSPATWRNSCWRMIISPIIQLGTFSSSLYSTYSIFWPILTPPHHPMGWHRLVQRRGASGRMNLYIAAHAQHIEDVEPNKSRALLRRAFLACSAA